MYSLTELINAARLALEDTIWLLRKKKKKRSVHSFVADSKCKHLPCLVCGNLGVGKVETSDGNPRLELTARKRSKLLHQVDIVLVGGSNFKADWVDKGKGKEDVGVLGCVELLW
jgi:hypothetical protein